MAGDKCKLTPERTKTLLGMVRAGSFFAPACRAVGIAPATFQGWVKRGELEQSGKYYEFVKKLRKAEAEAEVRAVAIWQRCLPDDWRACRDFLCCRYPERWSKAAQMAVQVQGGEKSAIHIYLPDNGRNPVKKDAPEKDT
ncbi:MAG: hypothetical protein V1755_00625 [Chloroflexota bacterium]